MVYSSDNSDNTDIEPPDSPLSGKTILFVNTGSWNKRFILERLKELGLKIVLLHHEKNWAQRFVDHWIIADTYNHQACISSVQRFLLRNPHIKIDGAVTFWEDDIPLLARLCEEFHYIGNSCEAATSTRSKFYMHEILRKSGRPYIPQFLLSGCSDLEKAISTIGFPAIIKPTYGSDSEYVVYVENEVEAREAYKYVWTGCIPEYNPIYHYNDRKFVYQKFIKGREFSAECFIQNGVPYVVGINEKTSMNLPFFVETGDYSPPKINTADRTALIEEVKAALIALGVANSLAHVEIKLTKEGPKIIEVASRMGGVYIYQSVKQVYGFDLIQAACEIACGIPVTQTPIYPQKYILAKFFIPKRSGVITVMNGFDALASHEYVIDFYIGKKIHDYIDVPPEGYETVGWVLTSGHSYSEVEKKMDHIMRSVTLEIAAEQRIVIPERIPVFKPIPLRFPSL